MIPPAVAPVPAGEKQPQSIMLPPPCFTVGLEFFGCLVFVPNVSFTIIPKQLYFCNLCVLANILWRVFCTLPHTPDVKNMRLLSHGAAEAQVVEQVVH